jgi:polar amino acid transport system substrate-binding protein
VIKIRKIAGTTTDRHRSWKTTLSLALCLPTLLLPLMASAACSRPMLVPVSAAGLSVIINGDAVSGIYPEILRSVADKEGCSFIFTPVPRARLELMFESGKADLIVPAKKTARRDERGVFIPLIHNRANLISIASNRTDISSAKELIEKTKLRLVLVRGYDYGPGYQDLITELSKQKRVFFEAEPNSVARMLKAGAADLTIMTPYIFIGALKEDPRLEDLINKIRYEAIPEIPWSDSGAYLSKNLSEEDLGNLRKLLERSAKSGAIWKNFQQYYPADMLKDSIRPLDATPIQQ